MPDRDHDRPVPRRDRPDNPDGLAVQFHPTFVVVLKHLDVHCQRCRVARPGLRAAQLEARPLAAQRLALFGCQKLRQLFGVLAKFCGHGLACGAAFGVGGA